MSRLLLPAEALAVIERAARREYPRECCGLLVGRASEGETRVTRAEKVLNVSSEAEHRFRIDDRVLLEAHRGARREGLEIVGYFHSHPEGSAAPSALDEERAHPGTSYVIASVREGAVERIASWRLAGAGEGWEEESIESTR